MSMCTAVPDVMWLQHHAGTYRSVDGGAHWSRLTAPLRGDFGFVIVADPANPLRAWVVPATADTHRYAVDGAMCAFTGDGGPNAAERFARACRSSMRITSCIGMDSRYRPISERSQWHPRRAARGRAKMRANRGAR